MKDWRTVQSSQATTPAEFDADSSTVIVYQRRNIHTVEVEDEEGNKTTVWEFDERELTRNEYIGVLSSRLGSTESAIAAVEDALCDIDAAN